MAAVITKITGGAPASKTIIKPGDTLMRINGNAISDILDYKFHSYDSRLLLELTGGGKLKLVRIKKPAGADLGLTFDTYLMDSQRSCANRCIFCFIDQLPKGMRRTLYYKDDDVRLSFLQGNYITLTNLSQIEIERIIKLKISPVNISVHTANPELRDYMLGNKNGGRSLEILRVFKDAGITMNCQIVCCPGINDGAELLHTMRFLYSLAPRVNSVSVVPVGLTAHRQGLTELRMFDRELAEQTVALVEAFGEKCLDDCGGRIFFCADELYIKAELDLPDSGFYEGYPQLENGVGMMRLFISEFEEELAVTPPGEVSYKTFSVATGVAAGKYLTKLLKKAAEKYDSINGEIYTIKNEFFGENIDVSGLVTGGDIIKQLSSRPLGEKLLIPANMLRSGEEIFLDDVTVSELSEKLKIPVRIVRQDGADFLRAIIGK